MTGLNSDCFARLANVSIPAVLYKPYGRGRVVMQLGTPEDSSGTFSWLYDAMYLAMSKPLMVDTTLNIVGNLTMIPALETISMGVDIVVKNTWSSSLNLTVFNVFLKKGVKLMTPYPAECTVVTATLTPPREDLRSDVHLNCARVIPTLNQLRVTIQVFIEDVSVTQGGRGSVILYTVFQYTDGGRLIDLDYGAITVDAAMAALLRADANPQPLSHYPVMVCKRLLSCYYYRVLDSTLIL